MKAVRDGNTKNEINNVQSNMYMLNDIVKLTIIIKSLWQV